MIKNDPIEYGESFMDDVYLVHVLNRYAREDRGDRLARKRKKSRRAKEKGEW